MNRIICLFLFLGISWLTGCYHSPEVMTASEAQEESSEKQTNTGTMDLSDGQSEMDGADNSASTQAADSGQGIYVYVCGYVNAPGVYRLSENARICDALELAGGVTAEGRPEALNQAEHMTDGQTLYVPGMDEIVEAQADTDDGLVDINRADRELLMTLPGIGESKADVILQYREEHGAFAAIEDLMEIPGIKEGVFNKIKDKIKCN